MLRGKQVIWALFDDGNCSYKKATERFFNDEFIVYCFGINKRPFKDKQNYKYIELNLSITNKDNILSKLNKLPKPDIIMASPPCESWSTADCGGRMVKSIGTKSNLWEIQNANYYEKYNNKCHPVKRRYFLQKEISRINGENTASSCIFIIEHFEPSFWVIENPATSKIWEYIANHWCFEIPHMNKTYYSSYDKSFSTKPTIFASNKKLNLKTKKLKGNNDHMALGSYDKRSAIPLNLIKDILSKGIKNNI